MKVKLDRRPGWPTGEQAECLYIDSVWSTEEVATKRRDAVCVTGASGISGSRVEGAWVARYEVDEPV